MFKKFFDYYNDDIIGNYDGEHKLLDGQYAVAPITEADIEGPASIDGTIRTTPKNPITDIIRVDEFDNIGLAQLSSGYEEDDITNQSNTETALTSGYTAGSADALTLTASTITLSTTSIDFDNITNAIVMVAGETYTATDTGDTVVFEIVSFVDTTPGSPTPPPYFGTAVV